VPHTIGRDWTDLAQQELGSEEPSQPRKVTNPLGASSTWRTSHADWRLGDPQSSGGGALLLSFMQHGGQPLPANPAVVKQEGPKQREVMNMKRPGLQSSDSGCAGLGSCRWGPSQRNNCKAGRRACRLKLTILGLGRVWGQQTGAKILDGLNGAASANWKESLVRPVVIRT